MALREINHCHCEEACTKPDEVKQSLLCKHPLGHSGENPTKWLDEVNLKKAIEK